MRHIIFILLIILFSLVIVMPSTVRLGGRTFYRPRIKYRTLDLKLGLDLSGGAHLVYQVDTSKTSDADKPKAIEAARTNIERRVNLLGVSEPIIQTSKVGNDYRLIVELAGVKDVNQAIQTIGQTAQLEFKEPLVATPSSQADFASTGLTGADLRLAQVQFDSSSGQAAGAPVVGLEFTPEGAKKFAEITKKNIGKVVAIFLDDYPIMKPVVQNEITDGRAVISGGFTVDDAKRLTIQLNAGALPLPIKIIEQKNVGATLGSQSITKSLVAGAIGLVLIWLFMLTNYGLKGLLANIALIVYVLLSVAIIKLVPVTLTLAGIAGLILSIGMAVDANILIFERVKEELRWGRPLKSAIELGFHRAWNSIRDSNISSLITAGILFWFGSGSVRGFALTLIIGILVSLFTSINVTRALLRLVYEH